MSTPAEKLASIGWKFLCTPTGEHCGMHLPGGRCEWIEGTYQGVKQSGYYRAVDDMVLLHGMLIDMPLDAFLVEAVKVPEAVVEEPVRPRQGSLF
jgi:hypothetical protein